LPAAARANDRLPLDRIPLHERAAPPIPDRHPAIPVAAARS